MLSGLLGIGLHENILWPDIPYVTDQHGSKQTFLLPIFIHLAYLLLSSNVELSYVTLMQCRYILSS